MTAKRNGDSSSAARGRKTLTESASSSPCDITPSAFAPSPSARTSKSARPDRPDFLSVMSCRSTLEPCLSSRQLAIARSEIGAKRSARSSSAAPLTHFSASLSAFSVAARASTSRACSSQPATWVESSCQAAPRRSSSPPARAASARRWPAAARAASRSVAAAVSAVARASGMGGEAAASESAAGGVLAAANSESAGCGALAAANSEPAGGARSAADGAAASADGVAASADGVAASADGAAASAAGVAASAAGGAVAGSSKPTWRAKSGAAWAVASNRVSRPRRAAATPSFRARQRLGLLAQRLRLLRRVRRPGVVEHVRGAADGAVVGEPLRIADRERLAQQRRDLRGPTRVGLRGVALRPLGDPERGERLADHLVGGHVQPGQAAQQRGVAAVVRGVLEQLGDRGQVRLAGLERGGDQRGVLVVGVQPRDQAVARRGDGLALVVVGQPGRAERRRQLVDVGQPEHRGQCLVQGRQRVEHRRQLGVRQERPEARQVAVPAVLRQHRRGTGAAARVVVRRAVRPLLRERDLATALQHQLGRDPRRALVVQALPGLRPRLRALLPALQPPGHQQLEALGERRLAGPVATDDDRQPGRGLQGQRGRRPDPAEARDGHRTQPNGRRRPVAGRLPASHATSITCFASPSRSEAASRSSSSVRRTGSIRSAILEGAVRGVASVSAGPHGVRTASTEKGSGAWFRSLATRGGSRRRWEIVRGRSGGPAPSRTISRGRVGARLGAVR